MARQQFLRRGIIILSAAYPKHLSLSKKSNVRRIWSSAREIQPPALRANEYVSEDAPNKIGFWKVSFVKLRQERHQLAATVWRHFATDDGWKSAKLGIACRGLPIGSNEPYFW
jgi:hypothetical protein